MNHQTSLRLTAALLLLAFTLSGCQMLYMFAGKGSQEALYVIPKGARVLIFVDVRPTAHMPAEGPLVLGEKIADHLFRHKAADNFVAQQRLSEVRRLDDFRKMGIADIARATDADVVLHVDVIQYTANTISDSSISEGSAAALVKVVDRQGNRLWPPEGTAMGAPVQARLDPLLTEQRDLNAVHKELAELLTIRIGRMFHAYDLEDKEMTK